MMLSMVYFLVVGVFVLFVWWDSKKWEEVNGMANFSTYQSYKSPMGDYNMINWEIEMGFVKNGRPLVCPWCLLGGDYGPRDDKQGRKYRACKQCGMFQNVGESKEQARVAVCEDGHKSWTLNKEGKKCDICHKYTKFHD